MSNDDLSQQMEELKAQLETLQRQREADEASRSPAESAPQPDGEPTHKPEGPDTESREAFDEGDLVGQLHELLDALDRDIRESNPTTLLAVFAFGVLFGRMMPR
jgi:hypothetical protein